MSRQIRHFYEFGSFRLDSEKHRLMRSGDVVALPPKALEALLVLVRNAGRLIEREELMQAVWSDTFVEDANLTVAISQLRKALGQQPDKGQYIQTVPRVGYRFVADVREIKEEPTPLIVETHTVSKTVIEEELLPGESNPTLVVTSRIPFRIQVVAVALTLAVSLAGTYYFANHNQTVVAGTVAPSLNSIAILPPQQLNTQIDSSALQLGIADALITRIGALRKISVRPTRAITRYLGSLQDPVKIGKSLKVDAVLEGSLQRSDGRVRVSLRLLDVKNGTQLWSGNFDQADGDLLGLQDSIAQQVAAALSLDLTPAEQRWLTTRQTSNQQAYKSYLLGNYFWSKRGDFTSEAIGHFRKAIDLDPMFAEAYVGLANVHATGALWPEAESLIEKALNLDSTLAEAHATYGFIKMFRRWDWSAAEKSLDRAIELDPASSNAHHWKGVYLSLRGRIDEAKAEMHRALELDPLSLIITADIGQLHYFGREYDQAIEYCKRALALDSSFQIAHHYLGAIYEVQGREEEAFSELAQGWSNDGSSEFPDYRRAFDRAGLKGVADLWLKRALDSTAERNLRGFSAALLYLMLQNREQALISLERGFQEKQFLLPFISVDPRFDSLRNEPRFQKIVASMGL